MTAQTGAEWQLVGSLVSEPFGGSTGSAPQKSNTVDYLFRGSVTQIAEGTSGAEALPWSLPPKFVAELQVIEPSNTAALTVVFLDPLGQAATSGTTGAPAASAGTTDSAQGAT